MTDIHSKILTHLEHTAFGVGLADTSDKELVAKIAVFSLSEEIELLDYLIKNGEEVITLVKRDKTRNEIFSSGFVSANTGRLETYKSIRREKQTFLDLIRVKYSI